MDFELGIGGDAGELSSTLAGLVTGDSPAAVKSRAFFVTLCELVAKDEHAKEQFIEALTALKNTGDEVWKDVPHAKRFVLVGTLKTILGAIQ